MDGSVAAVGAVEIPDGDHAEHHLHRAVPREGALAKGPGELNTFSCREIREAWELYLDGELPEAEVRALSDHLQACPDCKTWICVSISVLSVTA